MRKYPLFCFISLIFVTLFFASCINITDSDSQPVYGAGYVDSGNSTEFVTLTGRISTNGALPSQVAENLSSEPARSAVPSISATGFFIQAVSGGETINGTVSNNGTYSISLALGRTYTITAELKDGTTTLMSDEWPDVTPTRANAGNLIHDFLLKPVGTANGFVELRITISNSNVKKIKISCSDTNFGSTIEENITGTTYTFSKSKVIDAETGAVSGGMKIGIYEVTFSFYNTSGILLYSSTQSVTVLSGQTTNKWISGGGSAEPINSSGTFNVTSALIKEFARTQIYVGTTSVGTASDSGTGSPYAPFDKVQKAIALIESAGTSTSDYNIWINGTITGCTEIPNTITTSKARTITIQGTSGNTTDTLNGNKNGTVLTVNSAVSITIKNLKITGGKNTNGDGGGIYMKSGTKVTLGTGALVGDVIETTPMAAASYSTDGSTYGNIAKNGGGIYNNGGTLILENGSYVSHNYAGGTEQDSGEAGGIYVNGGSVEIKEGASIRLNKCYSRGGGLSLHGGCSVTITGGSIEYNEVNLWGGGIFCGTGSGSVRFEMTGGSISHNKSTLSSKDDIGGGGIYLDDSSASFTMSGTALISENYAARKGGALMIGNGSSFEMTGGTISKNWSDASGSGALTGGGAVFLYGTLKMSGNANIPLGALVDGTLVTGVNKNDVKFYLGATVPPTVVITGALTASTTVATITLSEWKRGTTVVQANTNISGYKDYFAFTDEGWETIVASDKKSLFINQPIYVAGATTHPVCGVAGSDGSGANGTKSHPYATIAQACTTMNDETVDYILKIDGEVTGAQEIPDTLTKTTSGTYKAKTLTLCGASGLDSDKKPQDSLSMTSAGTILTISTEVPVTLENLKIQDSDSSSTPTTGLTLATGKSTDVTISNGVVITKNYNSGVKIGTQGKLTLKGGDITTNRAEKGAGVMNDGTFIMSGGFIEGNIITTTGGKGAGVYISGSGKLEMSGGYIIRNTAGYGTAVDGGGVYFSGTFEFQGGEIWGNYAYNCGGGLYADGGTLFMSGTAELGNKNVDSRPKWPGGNSDMNKAPNGSGGAIYSKGASKLYIGYTNTDGTPVVSNFSGCIKGNYAKENGGGIYTTNEIEEFHISGGTISYNATEGKGGAIYVSNKLFLLNKAYIPGQTDTDGVYNDVYLDTGKYITVTEGLTGHDTVATITPSTYSTNTRALAANSASLDSTCTKFEVTKESDNDKNWIVNSDGKLKTVIGTRAKIVNNSILFNDGSSMPWTYSSSTAIELSDTQKQNAVAYIFKQDRSTYYGISLREASLAWAKNGGQCMGYNNSNSKSDTDGQENTNVIASLSDNTDATKYPAFYWAVNYRNTATNLKSYGSGWYVPSKSEMKNALSVFSYISSAMEKIGTPYADSFTTSGEFLTSTQHSSDSQRYVSVINSRSESNPKKDTAKKVRAMRKFN